MKLPTLPRRSTRVSFAVLSLVLVGGCVSPPVAVPTPSPSAELITATGTVEWVFDGDTIRVDGARIRLIGIDSPELDECGHDEALAFMQDLVAGREVVLTSVVGRDDFDQYGRLLRYVGVDDVDAGLALIEAGLAVARFDGRDHHGWHPREDDYIAADLAADDYVCPATE